MPRQPLPEQRPITSNPAILNALKDRPGWKLKPNGQWVHANAGITVHQDGPSAFTVSHGGSDRTLTSATGALCAIDAIERAAGAR